MVEDSGAFAPQFEAIEESLYLNRLDEAEHLLQELSANRAGMTVSQVTELVFAEAEYCYWRVRYEEAERHLQAALYMSEQMLNDPFCIARAYYGLARVERKRGNHSGAEELLNKAHQLLRGLTGHKARYLKSLIDFNLGVICEMLGELDRSEAILRKAVKELQTVESGRFYGLALNSLGGTVLCLGRCEEALSLFTKATEIFNEQAILEDLTHSRINIGFALIRLKRYREAEEILTDCLELSRRLSNPGRESYVLGLLAEIYLEKNDILQTTRYAEQAVEVAELSQNSYVISGGLVILGRCLAEQDRTRAIEVLHRAIELATESGGKRDQIEAYLYLADIMINTDRRKAREYFDAAAKLLTEYPDRHFIAQAEAIKKKLDANPVEVDEDTFVIHRKKLPTWRAAKRSLEMFLLKTALKETNYSGTETAKLLKISKATVTEKRVLYKI